VLFALSADVGGQPLLDHALNAEIRGKDAGNALIVGGLTARLKLSKQQRNRL